MAARRRAIAIAVALLASAVAHGEPGRPVPADAIAWHAPAECGDVAALEVRMAAYLDGPVAPGWFAEVAITPVASAYQGEARIGRAPAIVTRRVVGRDCAEVIDALGLVLGLSAQMPAPSPPPPPPLRPPVAVIAPDPPAPVRVSARVLAVGDLGTVPVAGLGGGLAGVVAAGPWAAQLGALLLPARFARIGATAVGVDVGLIAGQLAGCRRALAGVWLCAGLEVGWLRAAPVGLIDPTAVRRAWLAGQGTVSRAIGFGRRTSLVGELGVSAALVRPRFVLDDGTALFAPSSAAMRATIAVEVRLR